MRAFESPADISTDKRKYKTKIVKIKLISLFCHLSVHIVLSFMSSLRTFLMRGQGLSSLLKVIPLGLLALQPESRDLKNIDIPIPIKYNKNGAQKMMYVYILTNIKNTVLYIGVTNNLLRRVIEHREKMFDGFTKQYNVTKLVYYEYTENQLDAIEREKYLKKCYRKTKIKLITDFNPSWEDLFDKIR